MRKETAQEKETRIFNIYKNRIKNELGETVRFICIEYLCRFPKIDSYKMAAILCWGCKIVYDDSSISIAENQNKERKVKKMMIA